jgi:hypothetical protein
MSERPGVYEQAPDPERYMWVEDGLIKSYLGFGYTDEDVYELLAAQRGGPRPRTLYMVRIAALRRLMGLDQSPPRPLAVPDPLDRFHGALRRLRSQGQRLSQSALATAMEVDRGTLKGYIDRGLIPRPPWEGYKIPQ